MTPIFPPPAPVLVPIAGTDSGFPVRRIFCVGRNYAAHAREMGHDPDREPPFFFTKPADACVADGSTLPFPSSTADLHHEAELVAAIGREGEAISADDALDHVFGYAVGLDMTRRDLQGEAKKLGRPWDMAKGFDRSAPISAIRPATEIGHPSKGAIRLLVNGALRQSGDLDQQIWSLAETIEHLSQLVKLMPGDLVMTGTPEGVGPVRAGDTLAASIEGVGTLSVSYR